MWVICKVGWIIVMISEVRSVISDTISEYVEV